MKKIYSKPLISVEAMTLDQPIAANCDPEIKDVIEVLKQFGYFTEAPTCELYHLLPDGGFDTTGDGIADEHDTVCYHSNVQQAFIS